jgi:hypothetical protein
MVIIKEWLLEHGTFLLTMGLLPTYWYSLALGPATLSVQRFSIFQRIGIRTRDRCRLGMCEQKIPSEQVT